MCIDAMCSKFLLFLSLLILKNQSTACKTIPSRLRLQGTTLPPPLSAKSMVTWSPETEPATPHGHGSCGTDLDIGKRQWMLSRLRSKGWIWICLVNKGLFSTLWKAISAWSYLEYPQSPRLSKHISLLAFPCKIFLGQDPAKPQVMSICYNI